MSAGQSAKKDKKHPRAFIRFAADPNTVAWISTSADPMTFKGEQVALVINESYSGCSFIMVSKPKIIEGQRFTVQPGKAAPVAAVVRWCKEIAPSVWQLGCEIDSVELYRAK